MFLIIFILGLFFGSFFGVLIDRIPKGEGIAKGRSHCDFCKKELAWFAVIPLFSYLSTKGKCRYCRKKLSFFYPFIEITTGLIFVLTYFFVNPNNTLSFSPLLLINLIYYLFVVSMLTVVFFIDLKYGIIPDRINLLLVLVVFLYLLIITPSILIINIASALAAFLFFFLVSVIFYFLTKKQGMGGGDIKLSFVLGLFLGFPNIIVGLYLAFLTGTLASIILILWRKKSFRKDSLPFGPFLISGALISLLFGNLIYSRALAILGI